MLFRAIFWFSLVVMLLPVDSGDMDANSQNASGGETIVLFQSIANDLSGFCSRNPGSCETAKGLAASYGARVKAHAENLGEYLTENQEASDMINTGSIPRAE